MQEIINKVEKSGIIQLDPEQLRPQGKRMEFDIKEHLFQGLVLREKDFREFITTHDWSRFRDAYVHIHCSSDAIVPTWAYMLVAVQLQGMAKLAVWGKRRELEDELLIRAIDRLPENDFKNGRVVVKGCSNNAIGEKVYIRLTQRLKPLVRSLMFGEPCSAVPVYKIRT